MDEWFYIVTESMLRLGLRGTELSVFAILNGYSQKNAGCFFGTRQTLAERCGVTSRRTVDAALDSLLLKGMIRKYTIIREGVELVAYEVNSKFVQDLENLPVGVQNLHGGCANIAQGGCANSAHIENKVLEKKIENTTPPTPSIEQVAEHAKSKGFADPDGFAAFYVEYNDNRGWIAANGKPIIGWKNNINNNWMKFKSKTFDQGNKTYQPKFDFSK